MGRPQCGLARAALIVAGSVGCGNGAESGASRPDGPAVRDSAGVRIVESVGPRWGPSEGWRLAAEPTVRIGASDHNPAEQFTQVRSLYRLPDGRIVVTNRSNPPDIRIFDADGRHLQTLGRAGQGPGEFRFLFWSALAGDTVVAFDVSNYRLTYYDTSGELLTTTNTPALRNTERGVPGSLLFGRFSDGSFLRHVNRVYDPTEEGHHRDSSAWTRAAADGSILDTLGRFPGYEYVSRGPRDANAVLLGLRFVVHPQGEYVYVGAGDAFRIDAYDLSGALQMSMRRAIDRIPVTDAHVHAAEQRELDTRPAVAHPDIRRRYREAPRAEFLPAHGNLIVVDADGNVWVEEYLVPTDSVPRWTVFDSTGVFLGSVTMPVRFRPREIGTDYVLGVWRDEFNVEQVVLYPLIREPLG